MAEFIDMVDAGYHAGSYMRKQFFGYNLYKQFYYKELWIDVSSDKKIIRDQMVDFLHHEHRISDETFHIYYASLNQLIGNMEGFFEESNESLYRCICSFRSGYLAAEEEKFYRTYEIEERRKHLCREKAIDQTGIKQQLEYSRTEVLYLLTDELFSRQCVEDIQKSLAQKKTVYVLSGASAKEEMRWRELLGDLEVSMVRKTGEQSDIDFRGIEYHSALQRAVNGKQLFIMAYGEDALMGMKMLKVPAIVRAVPTHLYARALTNVFAQGQECLIYVPENFHMLSDVPIVEISRNSYALMANLEKCYGTEVYQNSTEKLYQQYPQEFINIYQNGNGHNVLWQKRLAHYPMVPGEHVLKVRESIAAEILKEQGIDYAQHYFRGAALMQEPIPWGTEEFQDGILVSTVLIRQNRQAVVLCAEGERTLSARSMAQSGVFGSRLISNFLFFATPKIIENYNRLRDHRKPEQIHMLPGHIDYMLEKGSDGTRKETFPLYQKACIGMDENGKFTFFHFRLGGGKVHIAGSCVEWHRDCVNTTDKEAAVQVYTPLYSLPDSDGPTKTYLVGADRVNLIIIGDRLVCARQGEVMLPSIGVVLSLEAESGRELMKEMGAEETEEHYFLPNQKQVQVELDAPEGFSEDAWSRMRWIYGGAMSLIRNGSSVFPIEGDTDFLRNEGWLSPLSRETQESSIHELEYHPRTAVGITGQDEVFVMVISGRSKLSRGADYTEVCRIAKKLFPQTRAMVNVDGGASSVLGLALNGEFMELSMPAVSDKSCAGMARDISTMLCFDLDQEKRAESF